MNIYPDQQIIEKYKEGLSAAKVAKIFGLKVTQINWVLDRNNFKRRDLSHSHITKICNYDFFEKIDTEEKAYWLGFLYADGSVTHNNVKLTLANLDYEHLLKFKKALNSNHKVINDRGVAFRVAIGNLKMYNDVIKLGCTERKTFTIKFPNEDQVPAHLVRDFIRGYFDGDGCITYSTHKKRQHIQWRWDITSNCEFVESVRGILSNIMGFHFSVSKEKRCTEGICYLCAGSTSSDRLKIIYEYLYKNSTIFLQRKHDKFLTIFDLCEKRVEYSKNHPFTNKNHTVEYVKLILLENCHKPIGDVCEILERKCKGEVRKLYKKYNIPRVKFIHDPKIRKIRKNESK